MDSNSNPYDLYEVLEVLPHASSEEIRKAY